MPILVLTVTATLQSIANSLNTLATDLTAAGVAVGSVRLDILQSITIAQLATLLTTITGTLTVSGTIASRAAFDTLAASINTFRTANPTITVTLVYQETG